MWTGILQEIEIKSKNEKSINQKNFEFEKMLKEWLEEWN